MTARVEQNARGVHLQDWILATLRDLRECCHLPLRGATWPSDRQLDELDFAVVHLAKTGLKRPMSVLTPYWKAYERVNKLRPEIQLLPRVKDLVRRADKLLKEVGESDLVRLRRKAAAGAPEAKRLAESLEAMEDGVSKAAKVEWENYERLLFSGSDNKPIQLKCGELSASPRMRCYARALEILTDYLRQWAVRSKAVPLLTWINGIGSPYAELLSHDYQARYCADYLSARISEATTAHKREQWRKRQKKHRDAELRAKLLADLRAKGYSEAECERILTEINVTGNHA